MNKTMIFAALVATVAFTAPAFADADAAAGQKVFNQCKACHENEKGVSKVGPTLKGIVGRAAASVEGYTYSDPMKAKGTGGLIWTEENLAAYLPNPKAFVPGTKMAFGGVKKPEDLANLIAYLKANP